MANYKLKTLENSSVVVKFQVFFIILAFLPLSILMYLYYELKFEGVISISVDQLNAVLIFVVIGIGVGYVAMRMLLTNLVDVTKTSVGKLREIMGAQSSQNFGNGDDNEIALLGRTFSDVTFLLKENVSDLQTAKKTLQSVLTKVGGGSATFRDIDSFLDLIVETMTEALSGKQGLLLLVDNQRKSLVVKTIFGSSKHILNQHSFSIQTSPFSGALTTRTPLIIPKAQFLSGESSIPECLEFPLICAPLVIKNEVIGVIALSGRTISTPFQDDEMSVLLDLATQTAVAIENSKLNSEAGQTYFETLSALAMAVEAKDHYSRGHLERVGQTAVALAEQLGLSSVDVKNIRDAAKILDVGKIGIMDEILTKQLPLTPQEWIIMKRHPDIGETIIHPVPALEPLCDLVRHHHERLDGSGYPDGLKGDQISLSARILAIADIFVSLRSDRPYRKSMSFPECMKTLRDMGTTIDQKVVDAIEKVNLPTRSG